MAGAKAQEVSGMEKEKEKGVQKRKTRSVCSVTKSECADNSECCETSEMLVHRPGMTPVDLHSASTTAGKKTINIPSLT